MWSQSGFATISRRLRSRFEVGSRRRFELGLQMSCNSSNPSCSTFVMKRGDNKNNTQLGVEVDFGSLAGGVTSMLFTRHLRLPLKTLPVSHLHAAPIAVTTGMIDKAADFERAAFVSNSRYPFVSEFHELPKSIMSMDRRGLLVFMSKPYGGLQEGSIRPGMEVPDFDGRLQAAEFVSVQVAPEPFDEVGNVGKERFTQSIGRCQDKLSYRFRRVKFILFYNNTLIITSYCYVR